jgi:predicted MPP superfamily phosphohydrolase
VNHLDQILSCIFALVQARITWLCLLRTRSAWARAAVWIFDAVLAIACVVNFTDIGYRLHLARRSVLLLSGAECYLVAATAILAIHTALSVARRFSRDTDPGRRRVLNLAGNALMATPFAAMGYGAFVQRTDFRVSEVDLPIPQLAPGLDGLRLLQISDIHLSPFLSEKELARVIDAARELRAHLVLVTGDLISGPGDPLDACIRQLARLKSDAGTFACMGNHERYAGVEDYTEQAAAKVGIRFLRLESQMLRFGDAKLNLAGVDYQPLSARNTYLRGAGRLVAPGALNVLLSHNPDVFPVAAGQGYDLTLAGHTHGGQVTIEILERGINPARFLTPYVRGLYRTETSAAYVSRGIGTIGIPARIGVPPEISFLRLRKA